MRRCRPRRDRGTHHPHRRADHLIEVEGWRLLTDPTFDALGRRYSFGWGTSSRKLAVPAIPADDLLPIDAVLLTHDLHASQVQDGGADLQAVGDLPHAVAEHRVDAVLLAVPAEREAESRRRRVCTKEVW
jgi:hypothetical protein